ncbi:MAG: hypothetical protein LBJ63_07750 [Prevotellaceae bacterium]|jgi:hypothetical protein|nr:hypothetical protein [Prevotellaceae bacterium]
MNKEEIIKHYRTMLPCEQFVVTGTYALVQMGLADKSDDIDIILVNPTEEAKNTLERLMKDSPAETKPSPAGELLAIFMHENVKIDVFLEKSKVSTLTTVDDIQISSAKRIFEAKKKMSRFKDWVQLRKIAMSIFKQSEFETYLNNQL